ncbi:hypothetical protein BDZ91DRAFT_539577 [Kalaharituber pfeilii]|nr:hypothetical protein BDZ91DRAFT_539577 [Kalaharituber pfeilii]
MYELGTEVQLYMFIGALFYLLYFIHLQFKYMGYETNTRDWERHIWRNVFLKDDVQYSCILLTICSGIEVFFSLTG